MDSANDSDDKSVSESHASRFHFTLTHFFFAMPIMGLFLLVMIQVIRSSQFGFPPFDLLVAAAICIGAAAGVLARGPHGLLRGAGWGLVGGLLYIFLSFCIVQM